MAATEHVPAGIESVILGHGEALGRDAVWWVQNRIEDGGTVRFYEEAEERRFPVVSTEAFDELGIGEDAAPAWADEGSAGERGWLWREAEENLVEEVLVIQRVHWRGMEAAHPG